MHERYNVSFLTQLSVLLRRAFLSTLRDPLLLKVKLTQIIVTALSIGFINWKTPLLGPSLQNLEGVLYNCARDMTFLFFFPSINVITSELPIFMREYKAQMYSVESYYISKSLAELPQYTLLPLIYSTIIYWMTGLFPFAFNFLIFTAVNVLQVYCAISIAHAGACVFGEEGLALTYMPMFVMPMLVFGGFYINFHNIPTYLKPLSYLSFFKYGFESLQINQWYEVKVIDGCSDFASRGNNTVYCPSGSGKELLAKRGMDGDIVTNVLSMLLFVIAYHIVGLLALLIRSKTSI